MSKAVKLDSDSMELINVLGVVINLSIEYEIIVYINVYLFEKCRYQFNYVICIVEYVLIYHLGKTISIH